MSKGHKIKHIREPKLNHDFNKVNSSNRTSTHSQVHNIGSHSGANRLQELKQQIGLIRSQIAELESTASETRQDHSGFIDSSNKAKDTAQQYKSRAENEDATSGNEGMIANSLRAEGTSSIREGYSSIFTGQSMTNDNKITFLGSTYIYQGQMQMDSGRQTVLEADDHEALSHEAHQNSLEFREEEQNYLGEFAKEIQNTVKTEQSIEQIQTEINELTSMLAKAEEEYEEEAEDDKQEVSSTLSPSYTKEDVQNINEQASQLEQAVTSQASIAKQQSSSSDLVSNIQNLVNKLVALPSTEIVSSSLSVASNELNSVKSLSNGSLGIDKNLEQNISLWKDIIRV